MAWDHLVPVSPAAISRKDTIARIKRVKLAPGASLLACALLQNLKRHGPRLCADQVDRTLKQIYETVGGRCSGIEMAIPPKT